MKKFTTFGAHFMIELDEDQQIKIEKISYFPQYKGYTVQDLYDFFEMDPWNEEIFDIYENEIGGEVLDLIRNDLKDLSYTSKQQFLESDEELKLEYENGEVDESVISDGTAFDLIWESQTEDSEWQEKYIQFLANTIEENSKASKKIKNTLQEILENAKQPLRDSVVMIIYRISAK